MRRKQRYKSIFNSKGEMKGKPLDHYKRPTSKRTKQYIDNLNSMRRITAKDLNTIVTTEMIRN